MRFSGFSEPNFLLSACTGPFIVGRLNVRESVMAAVKGRSVAENPRNGRRRICLSCARWEPTAPSRGCSHPEIATLDVNDRDLSVLSGFAKAVDRADRQKIIALGALRSFVHEHQSSGNARVQPTHVDAGNVKSLIVRRASVRVG